MQIRPNPRIPFKNTSTLISALEDIRPTMLWDHLGVWNNPIYLQIDFDDVDVFFTMCHSGYLSSFRFNLWCLCSTDHGYTSVRPMNTLSCLKWNEIHTFHVFTFQMLWMSKIDTVCKCHAGNPHLQNKEVKAADQVQLIGHRWLTQSHPLGLCVGECSLWGQVLKVMLLKLISVHYSMTWVQWHRQGGCLARPTLWLWRMQVMLSPSICVAKFLCNVSLSFWNVEIFVKRK